jgi:hypothetical protein
MIPRTVCWFNRTGFLALSAEGLGLGIGDELVGALAKAHLAGNQVWERVRAVRSGAEIALSLPVEPKDSKK